MPQHLIDAAAARLSTTTRRTAPIARPSRALPEWVARFVWLAAGVAVALGGGMLLVSRLAAAPPRAPEVRVFVQREGVVSVGATGGTAVVRVDGRVADLPEPQRSEQLRSLAEGLRGDGVREVVFIDGRQGRASVVGFVSLE